MYSQVPPETVIESRVLESGVVDDNDVAVSAEGRIICLERFQEELGIIRVLFEVRMFNFTKKLHLATTVPVLVKAFLECKRTAIGVSRGLEVQQSTADNDGRSVQCTMWYQVLLGL